MSTSTRTVAIPSELMDKIEAYAENTHKSVNKAMREALEHYFAGEAEA